jgi:hypothetical protein
MLGLYHRIFRPTGFAAKGERINVPRGPFFRRCVLLTWSALAKPQSMQFRVAYGFSAARCHLLLGLLFCRGR